MRFGGRFYYDAMILLQYMMLTFRPHAAACTSWYNKPIVEGREMAKAKAEMSGPDVCLLPFRRGDDDNGDLVIVKSSMLSPPIT